MADGRLFVGWRNRFLDTWRVRERVREQAMITAVTT